MISGFEIGWRGLLSGRDVPPMLRMHARIMRASALVFAALLVAWLVLVALLPAEHRAGEIVVAIGMGLVGAVHTFARVLMANRAAALVAARKCQLA